MIRGYVAGPFRGANHWEIAENIREAERIALELWRLGIATYCPHTNTAHFQGAAPDEVWLGGHLEWLRLANVVVVSIRGEGSSVTVAEVQEALRLGIPVFFAVRNNIRDAVRIVEVLPPIGDLRAVFSTRNEPLGEWLDGQSHAR